MTSISVQPMKLCKMSLAFRLLTSSPLVFTIPYKRCYFSIQTICRRTRKTLTTVELRRSARKPWRHLNPLYYAALAKTLQALPQQQLQSPLHTLQQLQQQTTVSASLAASATAVPPVAVVAPLLSGATPSAGEKPGMKQL